MQYTDHIKRRINQRGIKQEYLHLLELLGRDFGDKRVLTRKNCRQFSNRLSSVIKLLSRIRKTGGSIEVSNDGRFLKAYGLDDMNELVHMGQLRMSA